MLELKDIKSKKEIEEAKKLFKEWDNKLVWKTPNRVFIEHIKNKAKHSLELAKYLLTKIETSNELEGNSSATLWIITQCYYSMFFEVEYLFALDNKKLPDEVEDTHKTMYLAFLNYYLIKGSELEQKNVFSFSTSRMSRALVLFKEKQDETLELQRVKKSVESLKQEKEKRNALTYQLSKAAEIKEAKSSVEKATEFRDIIEEYILSKKIK
ncbi:hypothetical protein HYY69_08660 [Candidatus Woesearchaeota archaeon]|nr:hypothetical protein [Candidatus Woesearchaeota archaeon]